MPKGYAKRCLERGKQISNGVKAKILISTRTFGEFDRSPVETLKRAGVSIKFNPYGRRLTTIEISRLIKDVDGVIAGTEPLTREALQSAKRLKVISRCGVGFDNVDMKAARELGITVCCTDRAHVGAVAELTLAFMLALCRKIPESDRSIRKGMWHPMMGRLLAGKRVGIVGLGRVGRRLVEMLKPFGIGILVTEPYPDRKFIRRHGLRLVGKKELLSEADIISLHLPLLQGDGYFIGEREFKIMRRGAMLINTSRGGLIDETALFRHLKSGRVGGAALDVFEDEPYKGRLKELDNVILTSHMGSYAKEARIQMELEAVRNLLNVLRGER